jgi:hypothetical protein
MGRTLALNLSSAIVQTRRSAPSVALLAERMGLSRLAVEALIRRGEDEGDVCYWPEMDSATLTPLGAERLRVRLAAHRWVGQDEGDPWETVHPTRDREKTLCETDLVDLDSGMRLDRIVLDPEPSAASMLEAFEAREAKAAELAGRTGTQKRSLPLLVPRHMAGAGANWGRAVEAGYAGTGRLDPRHCPECAGVELPLAGHCLRCVRSGADAHQPTKDVGRRRRRKKKCRESPAVGGRLSALVAILARGTGI